MSDTSDYKILQSYNREMLEEKVTEHLRNGYYLVGILMLTSLATKGGYLYTQTMMRD